MRRKELGIFLMLGAPISMIAAHHAHIGLKGLLKIETTLPSLPTSSVKDTIENFSILILFKNFSKKVPEPIKIFIGFYLLLFLILKINFNFPNKVWNKHCLGLRPALRQLEFSSCKLRQALGSRCKPLG